MRTARAVPTPWLCRNTMISRTTFCSAQASVIRCRPYGADAVYFAQAPGLFFDDVEHAFTKCPDQLAGIHRSDAPDGAGGEVFLHALGGRRRRKAQEASLELLAVRAVVDPLPGCRYPFPGGHHGRVAHQGDQIAVAAGLGPQDTEAAFGIVEGDALDQAGQDFLVRTLRTCAGLAVS